MRAFRILLPVAVVAASLTFTAARAAPVNDNRTDALRIPGVGFSYEQDTTGATMETAELAPDCLLLESSATVWFRYTPTGPVSQLVVASTAGSTYDTVIAGYVDATPEQRVGCNDEAGLEDHTSSMTFSARPGLTYLLQVAGVRGETGTLKLGLFAAPIAGGPDQCDACDFVSYAIPAQIATRAGEPSIGVNPKTNVAMFLALSRTVRARWDDSVQPPAVIFEDVTGPLTGTGTNDPILWTDPTTGRTFVAQLRAYVGSILEYTDDDGATWQQAEVAHSLPSWDHQTVGGGTSIVPADNPFYDNTVYYCAQAGIRFSQCARSDNGGLTWGAPIAMNTGTCAGLHGHVVVGADGSVYVPHKSCSTGDGQQAVAISRTGGALWQFSGVPGTKASNNDPAVAIDKSGSLYFAAESGGHAVVSTSEDGGLTWTDPFDVGAAFGIRNTVFPAMVAGDAGRAAVAFIGTPTTGDMQAPPFDGEWHLYVSTTLDGGATWTTQDLTPSDPVQRGCIWLQGGDVPCRNLLDFMGMTIDAEGRVLVGYADGCISAACRAPDGVASMSRASRGTIARQVSGSRLFAAFG